MTDDCDIVLNITTCAIIMSEPKKKPKSENKKPKSKITKNYSPINASQRPKKNNVLKKILHNDGIAKSKQLKQKLQTTKSSSYGRPKIRTNNKDNEIRLSGNGKPMPSLSELEKMFEDSDDDEENKVANSNKTPKKNPKPIPEEKLMSPRTISEIANRMLDFVSNISDPTELLEDRPPPPIIKPQKRSFKDHQQVPQKSSVKFCRGDEKYGPDSSGGEDEDPPIKRAKRSNKKVNISKSIFNAKSDEIAARLKECDGDSNESSDSNKTVAYEYYTPINRGRPCSFSPIPSTSKDNETFVKNDQRFNESIISENLSKTNLEDDIEVIETPCETIEIHDSITLNDTLKLNGPIIEIDDDCSTRVYNEKLIGSNKTVDINDDDSLQVVDVKPASPILVEDYYSNLDIENMPIDDVCEVINIDDIIAENKAIIEKYSNTSNLDTVTLVDTSINTTVQNNQCAVEEDNHLKNENNIVDTNSNQHSLTNDLSVICVSNEESSLHRPNIETGNDNNNVDVEVIDDSNHHPIRSINVPRNHRAVELVPINLESSLQSKSNENQELGNNRLRINQPFAPSHRCNCVSERRDTSQQHNYPQGNSPTKNPPPRHSSPRYCHHLTGINLVGDRCDVVCENPESRPTPNDDSYRQQLEILDQFFKNRQTNSQGRKRKPKKPRLSENILSQHFTSWLQSMSNNIPKVNARNKGVQQSTHTPSPASTTTIMTTTATTTDSPDKAGKRIGDCPICMDSLSNKPIVSTICGHVFCMDCIKLSIRSNGNKCPTCRKALKKGTGYHQIFL